jgi:hypothetical protein
MKNHKQTVRKIVGFLNNPEEQAIPIVRQDAPPSASVVWTTLEVGVLQIPYAMRPILHSLQTRMYSRSSARVKPT